MAGTSRVFPRLQTVEEIEVERDHFFERIQYVYVYVFYIIFLYLKNRVYSSCNE